MESEEPDRQGDEQYAAHQWIEHLTTGIKLKVFLVSGADAGDADKQKGGALAIHEVSVVVDDPTTDACVDVGDDTAEEIQLFGLQCICEELHQYGDVDEGSEYLVKAL